MLRKLFTTLSIVIASAGLMNAQNEAAIKVKLIDKTTKETIPFANVVVELGGIQAGVGTTNIDGEVMIKPLNPGKYNIKASYVGYQPSVVNNVIVSVGKTVYINMDMVAGQQLDVVEIVEYSVPLIDPDTKSGATITREEYQNMATKNINSVAATTAGVYQQDEGGALSVRGARSDATAYFVDGQKVIGSAGVPQSGVEQVTTIIGGTPAEYGDNTGGIISITTRGPSSIYNGGIELITSGAGEKGTQQRGLDAYGYNFIGFSVSGPLLMKKDSASEVKKSILGFSVSGEAVTVQDADPSAVGFYRVKPDVLADLEQNPLRPSAQGTGFVLNSEFITMNDLEKIKSRENLRSNSLRLNGKVVYQPTTNMTITAGGSVDYGKSRYDNNGSWIYTYSLFNSANNPVTTNNTWRAFAKLTQKFNSATPGEEEKSSSVIKNAYFTLQAGYEKTTRRSEDEDHKSRVFDYGYIGKFDQTVTNAYTPQLIVNYDLDGDSTLDTVFGILHDGFQYNFTNFTPGGLNPTGEAYTNQYLALAASNPQNLIQISQGLGLLNGGNAESVYALWRNTGRQYPSYQTSERSQFRVFGNFSADIKKHALQLGFEYEQRNERGYSLAPVGLWSLMRQLTNSHIEGLDIIPIYNPLSGSLPIYDFNRKNDGKQTQFDRSLRESLGLDPNGLDWINVDALDPSALSLDMFSPDDLLNLSGNSQVSYFGYDHTGKKTKGNPSLDDFFTKKDAKGNLTREVGAYRPIYIAGYIQDKFDFKDVKFNVGLRIDRFDANQKVLKDKYLLYEAKTAGEVDHNAFNTTLPSNIGGDYVVYVDDKNNPTKIVGYRDGDVWYNAQGVEVSDPAASLGGPNTTDGRVNPYLLDAQNKTISSKVFKDFDPQINLMPRIAFAFPISDVANFFAHYDVLTQRPPSANRLDPYSYLNLQNDPGTVISNPDLKPQKTTDYELGYTQVLNEKKNSAITLSAFYRELRNLTQVSTVNQAYPTTYITYDNVDFGTVKGFSFAYDLRRTAGVRLTASYTLQFADGTGSSATDGVNLASTGLPNLRTTHPLDFDQRHTVVLNIDYRFGAGKDYRGPAFTKGKGSDKEKVINVLENIGANVVLRAGSGTPYSKQSNFSEEGSFGAAQRRTLSGDINGSNLPWNFKVDLRVDKNINLKWGGKKEGAEKKSADLNIYLQVLNVLNNKNVLNVYRATGNPNDDGYVNSVNGQLTVAAARDAQSYTDLYGVKINNPNNYSRPRVIRLGLLLNF